MYKAATQIESIIMLKNPFSKTQPEFDKSLWYKGVTIIILFAFLFSVIDSIYYKINSQYNILDFVREHLQMPVLISYILICRILIRKKFGDIIYTYTDSFANNKNDCKQIVSHRIYQSKWMEWIICLCTIVVGYVLFQPWKTNVGHINSIYLYSVEGIFFGLIGWYIYIFFNNVRILSDLNSKYVQDDLEITPPNIFQPSCFSDITEWSLKIIIFMIGLVILTLFLTPKYMFERKEYIYYVLYF
ncbi:MAG: Patatin [Candidatus Magnetoglobus multicellularis str. Araruama]|uniref:Patatin n=1 Tax=Candidatus Magnetoglobus multicellularis str. Araruama TaxID=890399 RepID=A0A1V1P058_9BACT|nr:MAG: Patatin [Candidatus Magnetoglobus multicellularis str. Araruama]